MPGLSNHPDDFLILRFVARDLSDLEFRAAQDHLAACPTCGSTLAEIGRLDTMLRELSDNGDMDTRRSTELAQNDPFHERPRGRTRLATQRGHASPGLTAITAATKGEVLAHQILESTRELRDPGSLLSAFHTGAGEHRFAVFYALHEAGRASAEDPFRSAEFARTAIRWIRPASSGPDEDVAESLVPRSALRAQAHLLLAITNLWTSRFSRARAHLLVAYRGFAEGGGDETKLALVELAEAQRRALSNDPLPALPLVRRARETFTDRGLEDYAARSWVVEGLALHGLDRDEDALTAYRQALPAFERGRLWSNYVGAVNSMATSLNRLGRHEEARREYARALRHFSRVEHRFWLGYLRVGLAESLSSAGRFDEAAVAAARASKVFGDCRLRARELSAMLFEIENWARHGDLDRARHRLALFWTEIERDGRLDPVALKELADALTGANPDFKRLAEIREAAANQVREQYRTIPA